jgi:hypothetical protein
MAAAGASGAGLARRCTFVSHWTQPVDTIVCVDAFEHVREPVSVLHRVHRLLKKGGQSLASFGPPWKHPLGGHLYSVFPYSPLAVPDAVLVRWRSRFKPGGARTVLGSVLNNMTVGRFERLVAASPSQFEGLDTVPIRRLRRFANRLTREFTTSVVRSRREAREA